MVWGYYCIIISITISVSFGQFVIPTDDEEPEREESCHLPTGKPALCVPVERCRQVQNLIKGLNSPLETDIALLIRDGLFCRNRHNPDETNLCCPIDGIDPPPKTRPFVRDLGECVLSNGLGSSCVTFSRCSPFLALLKNLNGKGPLHPDIPNLIQNAWKCGRDENRRPQVCCPDPAIFPLNPPDDKKLTTPTPITSTKTTEEEITTTPASSTTRNVVTTPETPESTTLSPREEDLKRFESHPNRRILAPSDMCGHPAAPSRIVGGKDASLGQFPWLVNIGYRFRSKPEVLYRCGGALIGAQYVLTAAHCVSRLPRGFSPSTIRIGEFDLSKDDDCFEESGIKICSEPVQNFDLEKIIPHPLYGKTPHNLHDIALVKLERSAIENDYVTTICLPFSHDEEENYETSDLALRSLFTVAGWGATTNRGTHPADILQYLDVSIFNSTQCSDVFKKRSSSVTPGNQICAGGEKNKDSCSGDSGSALMQEFAFQYTAVGVVSFGPKLCGTEGVPGVYTRVRNYLDWILDNLE
uniref:CLIP domain-containing serine protease n=1 Tax=Lepeophtheirus salmonis TaxID=72036 RepID=A0A0K2VJJ2_LEPSM